jgi:hypothetical protein
MHASDWMTTWWRLTLNLLSTRSWSFFARSPEKKWVHPYMKTSAVFTTASYVSVCLYSVSLYLLSSLTFGHVHRQIGHHRTGVKYVENLFQLLIILRDCNNMTAKMNTRISKAWIEIIGGAKRCSKNQSSPTIQSMFCTMPAKRLVAIVIFDI